MSKKTPSPLAGLPSVDRLLNSESAAALISKYGRRPVAEAIRKTLGEIRRTALSEGKIPDETEILSSVSVFLTKSDMPSLRTVYNLTGTVLHTNLGRATLPEEAIEAVMQTVRGASNLEYRIDEGKRGDRDEHIEAQLCELTGAEAATIVNNNAAAVIRFII